MKDIDSPCIKVCKTDLNDICIGCRRTRDEIGDWSKLNNEQKQAILDKSSERRIIQQEEPGGFSF